MKERQKRDKKKRETSFLRWPEISVLSHVKTALSADKRLPREINYKAKAKLHGTNASVVVKRKGKEMEFWAQRRNGVMTESDDANSNFGFVPFAYKNEAYFKDIAKEIKFETMAIFGEWCGNGIMAGAAICSLQSRHFAVFGIVFDGSWILYEPDLIKRLLKMENGETNIVPSSSSNFSSCPSSSSSNHSQSIDKSSKEEDQSILSSSRDRSDIRVPEEILVVPWMEGAEFNFDFSWSSLSNQDESKAKMRAESQKTVDRLNQLVSQIDLSDPFVKHHFGIDGVGEGIVCYPVSINEEKENVKGEEGLCSYAIFSKLVFKAKGKSHRVVASKNASSIDLEVASSINEFIDMFVTPQRCEQGFFEKCSYLLSLHFGSQYDPKLSSDFVSWMIEDIKKEGKDEMGTLSSKGVNAGIRSRSLAWFNGKMDLLGLSPIEDQSKDSKKESE